MSKAFVVGLTGPIGSGKSVVAKIFEDDGYKIIDADVVARQVVEKGSDTLIKLAQAFGDDIINNDGTLDRKLLAKRAFSSKEKSNLLNKITHPAIINLVKLQLETFASLGYLKILYDAPLLFESETDKLCDKIVTVIADANKRLDRVKLRDNMTDMQVKSRMDSQHSDEFYIDKSDFVIYNNFSFDRLLLDTKKVINALKEGV